MGLKAIFHIDESPKWDLLLKNAANLVRMADMETAQIEVLANAEAVRDYAAGEDTAHIIDMQRLAEQGVLFAACNNALKAHRVNPDQLVAFVKIVPAGVLELTERQMQGYAYIKP